MSHIAVSAALALEDLCTAERLVAFSLASYANPEQHAWPGDDTAAARAGLSRSAYLAARARLLRRELITVAPTRGGRGHKSEVIVEFARTGPWWPTPVNPGRFESVLGHSHTRGPARLLLAALAALADDHGRVAGLTTEEIRAAAGLSDAGYRRARSALLAAGEAAVSGGGGRGNTNHWQLADLRALQAPPAPRRRVRPSPSARPLMAITRPLKRLERLPDRGGAADQPPRQPERPRSDAIAPRGQSRSRGPRQHAGLTLVWSHDGTATSGSSGKPAVRWTVLTDLDANPAITWTVSAPNHPGLGAIPVRSDENPARNPAASRTVSCLNPAASRTVSGPQTPPKTPSDRETPSETPPKTPSANARAGKEPQNQGTKNPPNPPAGGDPPAIILVEETFHTDSGRQRRRMVPVDLADVRRALSLPSAHDRQDWQTIRAAIAEVVPRGVELEVAVLPPSSAAVGSV